MRNGCLRELRRVVDRKFASAPLFHRVYIQNWVLTKHVRAEWSDLRKSSVETSQETSLQSLEVEYMRSEFKSYPGPEQDLR